MEAQVNPGAQTTSTSSAPPRPVKEAPFALSSVRHGERHLKFLVYGRPGAGKTTLAASAVDVPQMKDVFLISAEGGALVLEDNPRVKDADSIDIARVGSFEQFKQIWQFLSSHQVLRQKGDFDKMRQYEAWVKGVDVADIETPRQYRTVIIDSLTEIEATCMSSLLGYHDSMNLSELGPDMATAEFVHYKKNNTIINRFIRAFRDLSMNVIVICHQSYEQDELKRFHYTPALTGKLSGQIQGYFDLVGFLNVGQPVENGPAPRALFVQPVGKFDAKCRRASFTGAAIENPTMLSIMKQLKLLNPATK